MAPAESRSSPRLRAVREGGVALRVGHRRERRRQDVRRERALWRRAEADEVAALLQEFAAVVLAVEALLEERHVERVGLLEQLRARRVLARRHVPHEVHDEVLVARA